MFKNQLTARPMYYKTPTRAYPKQPVSVLFRPLQSEIEFRFDSDSTGIFILGLITGAVMFSRS